MFEIVRDVISRFIPNISPSRAAARESHARVVALVGLDPLEIERVRGIVRALGGVVLEDMSEIDRATDVLVGPNARESAVYAACIRGKQILPVAHVDACAAKGTWMPACTPSSDARIGHLAAASMKFAAQRGACGQKDAAVAVPTRLFDDDDEGDSTHATADPFAGWRALVILPEELKADIERAVVAGGGSVVASFAQNPSHAIVDDSRTIDDESELQAAAEGGCVCIAWRCVRDTVMAARLQDVNHYSVFEEEEESAEMAVDENLQFTPPPQALLGNPRATPRASHLVLTPSLRSAKRPASSDALGDCERSKRPRVMLQGHVDMVEACLEDEDDPSFAVALARALTNPLLCPPAGLVRRLFDDVLVTSELVKGNARVRTAALIGMLGTVFPPHVTANVAASSDAEAKENTAMATKMLTLSRPEQHRPVEWSFAARPADIWEALQGALACECAHARGAALRLLVDMLAHGADSKGEADAVSRPEMAALVAHAGLREMADKLYDCLVECASAGDVASCESLQRLIALAYDAPDAHLAMLRDAGKQERKALHPRQNATAPVPAGKKGAASVQAADALVIQRASVATNLAFRYDSLAAASKEECARTLLLGCRSPGLQCAAAELLIARHCDGQSALPENFMSAALAERLALYAKMLPPVGCRAAARRLWAERLAVFASCIVDSSSRNSAPDARVYLAGPLRSLRDAVRKHAPSEREWGPVIASSVARIEVCELIYCASK